MRVRGHGVPATRTAENGKRAATCSSPSTCRCPTSSTSTSARRSRRWPARSTDRPTRRVVREASTTGGALMADTRALYIISVAAELAGVHPQTLRIYERKGLLEPARTSGRSRRLLRRRHRAPAPHPGAHHRRHLAGRRAADPRARGRAARQPATGEPTAGAGRGVAARDGRSGRRRASPVQARAGPGSQLPPSCDSIRREVEEAPWRSIPNKFTRKTQEALGAAQAAGRDAGHTEITPEHLLRARSSTSPRASSTACSSASVSTSTRCASASTRRSVAARR